MKMFWILLIVLFLGANPITSSGDEIFPHAPEALRIEHDQLHEDLDRCLNAGGETSQEAKNLNTLLRPHFYKEEKFVLPQLGVLNELVQNKEINQKWEIIKISQELKEQMPLILAEHKAVSKALSKFEEIGKRENKPQVECLTKRLKTHMKYEEEVFYPAAVLTGEFILLKEQVDSRSLKETLRKE